MSITVNYLGILAGKAGLGKELIDHTGLRSGVLQKILKKHTAFSAISFVVAINGCIVHEEKEIRDGDQITLIPPAPGG